MYTQAATATGYRTANVTTADRLRLVIMCYEGCIANATRAMEEMERGQVANKGLYLGKAMAIVGELMAVLDHDRGGEIAGRLETLYRYVLDSLSQANLKSDPRPIESSVRILRELKDGWITLSERRKAV